MSSSLQKFGTRDNKQNKSTSSGKNKPEVYLPGVESSTVMIVWAALLGLCLQILHRSNVSRLRQKAIKQTHHLALSRKDQVGDVTRPNLKDRNELSAVQFARLGLKVHIWVIVKHRTIAPSGGIEQEPHPETNVTFTKRSSSCYLYKTSQLQVWGISHMSSNNHRNHMT